MLKRIGEELWHHIPYTAAGAVTGILAMAIIDWMNVSSNTSEALFYTFHPLHLLLSAVVTTALYRKFSKSPFWLTIPLCYLGPVIIGTLSDAVIPFIEGNAIHISLTFELPFIETSKMPFLGVPEWIVVNGAVLLGIGIGYFKPNTKFPHLWHILISTWATLLYFSTFGTVDWLSRLPVLFLFLFLAVWIPCAFSDIVFPVLIAGKGYDYEHEHGHKHGHAHEHEHGHDHENEHN